MALHEKLWRGNQDLAEACREHPFIQGIGDGSLAADAFKRYLAQDAFFLRAFLSGYALAAAKSAERTDVVRRLHGLMGGVLEELELHKSYAQSLDIDLDAVRPDPATSAYTDFLLRTGWSSDIGEILAAMTPCMRLYAYLGRSLSQHRHASNPYQHWIDTYGGNDFEGLAVELESLLDELATPTARTHSVYRYAMECELAFFSAPLTAAGS